VGGFERLLGREVVFVLVTWHQRIVATHLQRLGSREFGPSCNSPNNDQLIHDSCKYKNMDKITQILENVVRCKYFEAGVHIKNPIKNSYQDGLGRMTQTLDHVVVVHP
jgi:hypothetical protein